MNELMTMLHAVADSCDTYKIVETWDGEPGVFGCLSFRIPKDASEEGIVAQLLDYIVHDRDLMFFEDLTLVKSSFSENGDIKLSDPDGVYYLFRKV